MNFQAVITVAALLAVSVNAANLIKNGGFENPAFAGSFMTYGSGSKSITGWTVKILPSASAAGNVAINGAGFSQPFAGNQALDLTGDESGSPNLGQGVEQLVTTTVGKRYTLSFAVGAEPGASSAPCKVQVDVNGATRALVTNNEENPTALVYHKYSFTFTASSTKTAIGFYNMAGSPNRRCIIDAVSML